MEYNKNHEAFTEMCKLRKNPPIDIEFMDLSYTTKGGGKCNFLIRKSRIK